MVAFFVFIGIILGGVKLLAIANNISDDDEAMNKYGGKLFVVAVILFLILMNVIGNNDDYFN